MSEIKLTIRTIGKRINHLIETNQKLAQKGLMPVSLNIEGPAGVGKTSVIKNLANKLNMPFVRLDLGSITVDDLIGMPYKQVEICHHETNECVWVNEKEVEHYFKTGYTPTNNSRTEYALPKWFKQTEHSDVPMILYLDDFNRAPLQVLQACMPIIDEHRFNTFVLPAGSTVLLSSNPEVDDSGEFYSVTSMDGAHSTRYLKLAAKFDLDEWVEDYGEKNVDGRLINFFLNNPEVITGVNISSKDDKSVKNVPIRLWTKFADAISTLDDFSTDESVELISDFGSSLPNDYISMFIQFIRNRLDKIPTPKEILANIDAEKLLEGVILKNGKANAAISSIIQKRLCAFLINYSDEISQQEIDKIVNLIFNNRSHLFSKDLTHIAATKLVALKKVSKNPAILKIIAEQYK